MKRLAVLAAFTLAAAACGSDSTSNVGGPSGPPTTVVFTAQTSPANEVPPVTNADKDASGTCTMTFHLTRDSGGNIIAGSVDFAGTFSGFPAGTVVTGAHIHPGTAGTNGSVALSTGLTSGSVSFPNGSGSVTASNVTITSELANQIINAPSGYYFNIHTQLNPGGAARGQLVKQ